MDISIFEYSGLVKGINLPQVQFCLENIGLFYLKGSPILEAEHETFIRTTVKFFDTANEDAKNQVRGSKLALTKPRGLVNFLDYNRSYVMGLGDNLYPSVEFEQVWKKYFNTYLNLGEDLAKILGTLPMLKMPLTFDPELCFRHLPESPLERTAEFHPLRLAAHQDETVFTLIQQSPSPNGFMALEVQVEDEFIPTPVIPEALIVMIWQVGSKISKGKFKAPIHRVKSPPLLLQKGSERNSVAFFMKTE